MPNIMINIMINVFFLFMSIMTNIIILKIE